MGQWNIDSPFWFMVKILNLQCHLQNCFSLPQGGSSHLVLGPGELDSRSEPRQPLLSFAVAKCDLLCGRKGMCCFCCRFLTSWMGVSFKKLFLQLFLGWCVGVWCYFCSCDVHYIHDKRLWPLKKWHNIFYNMVEIGCSRKTGPYCLQGIRVWNLETQLIKT